MIPFDLAPTIAELEVGSPPTEQTPTLEQALLLRDAAKAAAAEDPSYRDALYAAQDVVTDAATLVWAELVRDKRGELDLACGTWDEGHCGCLHHGTQAACTTWNDGCNCVVGHDSEDACPKWAKGCCCEHAPKPDVAIRPCNNHTVGHGGLAHTTAAGRPWCPVHQSACGEVHPFVTAAQFAARYA